jgi:hypothetical protein
VNALSRSPSIVSFNFLLAPPIPDPAKSEFVKFFFDRRFKKLV